MGRVIDSPGETGGLVIKAFNGDVQWEFLTQYMVNVVDCARLHLAALIDGSIKDERIMAFDVPFNWNVVLDNFRELFPNKKFPDNQDQGLGSLTLLFAPQWGLQVLSPVDFLCHETGEHLQWQSVEPRPGHATVNVSNSLRFLSNYQLQSALHRALQLDSSDRYSIAYCLRPSDDSEFRNSKGQSTSAVNSYIQKNQTHESHGKQEESVFLCGIKEHIALPA
ncbi:hypothetical protein LQW54_005199 [Pestalotiopsis sp. IQ-011]